MSPPGAVCIVYLNFPRDSYILDVVTFWISQLKVETDVLVKSGDARTWDVHGKPVKASARPDVSGYERVCLIGTTEEVSQFLRSDSETSPRFVAWLQDDDIVPGTGSVPRPFLGAVREILVRTSILRDAWLSALGDSVSVSVVPGGYVPLTTFRVPRMVCRDFLGLPRESFIVGCCDSNAPERHWDVWSHAIARILTWHHLSKSSRSIRFVVSCEYTKHHHIPRLITHYTKQLCGPEKSIDAETIASYIVFVKNLSEENVYMNACDLVVTPTGSHVSMVDALVRGTPVVTSAKAAAPDSLVGKKSLLVLDENKVSSWTDAHGVRRTVPDANHLARVVWDVFLHEDRLESMLSAVPTLDQVTCHTWKTVSTSMMTALSPPS